jgi:hypothetical protein
MKPGILDLGEVPRKIRRAHGDTETNFSPSFFSFPLLIIILPLKKAVFWVVAPFRFCELNRRFGGTYHLHLQGRKIRERGPRWLQPPAHAGSSRADFSTLKMKAIRFSETLVQFTRSTRRHIPEDGHSS